MMHEFRVLYRRANGASVCWPAAPAVDLQSSDVQAETPEEAQAIVEGAGLIVVKVTHLWPLLDWHARTYNREEAAVFLRCTPSKIDELMAKGELPKARQGRPIFTREMLERAIEKRMRLISPSPAFADKI